MPSTPFVLADSLLGKHLAITGPSGCGKSMLETSLLQQQTARGGGWLVIDTCRDEVRLAALSQIAQQAGRQDSMLILDPESIEPATYSPLMSKNTPEIVAMLLNLLQQKADIADMPGYTAAVSGVLTAMIGALHNANEPYTFRDLDNILHLINRPDSPAGPLEGASQLAVQASLRCLDDINARSEAIESSRMRTLMRELWRAVAHFSRCYLKHMLNTTLPVVDLLDVINNNKMCYVVLPLMGKDSTPFSLGSMMLSDLAARLPSRQLSNSETTPPFVVIAHELPAYAPPDIDVLFQRTGAARTAIVAVCQTWNWTKYPGLALQAKAIVNFTETKISFKPTTVEAAQVIAEMSGGRISADELLALPAYEAVVMQGAGTYHVRPPAR